jgi:hypothetical protein
LAYDSKQNVVSVHSIKRFRLRVWAICGSAAAVIAILALIIFWNAVTSPPSWADVVKAVQIESWIHATTISGKKVEYWYSPKNQIFAICAMPEFAMFVDHRNQIRDMYYNESEHERIGRELESDYEKEQVSGFHNIFESLLRGDPPSTSFFTHDSEIVAQTSRRIQKSGRDLIEYDIKYRTKDEYHKVSFYVDPTDKHPIEMIQENFGTDKNYQKCNDSTPWKIEYPDEGPADIYALDVPKSVPLVDRTPSPELRRIVDAATKARKDFDPYIAVVSEVGNFSLVWHKGPQFRIELAFRNRKPNSPPFNPPALPQNFQWYKKNFNLFHFSPTTVCDGKTVYKAEEVSIIDNGKKTKWLEECRVEVLRDGSLYAKGYGGVEPLEFVEPYAYPATLGYPSDDIEVVIKLAGPNDPPGMILVEKSYQATIERFLVDPARSFVTVRHEIIFKNGPHSDVYLMDDFLKSPSGIWYPTKVQRKVSHSPDLKDLYLAETYYFYLDFPKDLPDGLFRPVSHDEILKYISD